MSRLRSLAARLAPALPLALLALGPAGPAGAAEAPRADLSVVLDASPKGLAINAATFTAAVTNSGPSDVSSARVWFSYPAGFTAPSASGCTIDRANRTAVCALGPIPSGATVTRKLTLHAGLLTMSGNLPVTAALVDLTPLDPEPGNNAAVRVCSALTLLLVSC
ncbi:DUF11 domain-containing protein [Streptomyces sp. ASQP_92]|uniref:DUF11 domain-containing protein n=1 Tax=Streptomyces sp. ASQP_92 TaxID=2979116 RepID=UPI0021C0AA61|nr:DUF11 domain-containing protein [Streptomyces sp. ASQP_92]MCT9091063.1 DUF11 domain-containing protein [Streptomyces sp. ASQP_92]